MKDKEYNRLLALVDSVECQLSFIDCAIVHNDTPTDICTALQNAIELCSLAKEELDMVELDD